MEGGRWSTEQEGGGVDEERHHGCHGGERQQWVGSVRSRQS